MSVIEFQTYIDNGTIELPKEYYDRIKGTRALLFSPTRATTRRIWSNFSWSTPIRLLPSRH